MYKGQTRSQAPAKLAQARRSTLASANRSKPIHIFTYGMVTRKYRGHLLDLLKTSESIPRVHTTIASSRMLFMRETPATTSNHRGNYRNTSILASNAARLPTLRKCAGFCKTILSQPGGHIMCESGAERGSGASVADGCPDAKQSNTLQLDAKHETEHQAGIHYIALSSAPNCIIIQ
ncbi:hypothetical protein B0H11DRAFT_1907461 [Mycena galericulata]|nr:hypothetical protein B0H11DRAFT_1907461 [Mycena galericulata]